MKPEKKIYRPEKESISAEIGERVAGALYMILADYSGMDMPMTTEFKSSLRDSGARFNVVGNRMLRRSLPVDVPDMLKGQTAMIYGSGDVVEVARIIRKFSAANKKPEIKGGFVEGKTVSARDVVELARLPAKNILRAQLLGTMQAPCSQLVGVLNQKVASLVYVLNAVKGKKEEEA